MTMLQSRLDRLEEISQYEAGWLDGDGEVVSADSLTYARDFLTAFSQTDLAEYPAVFATEAGGVSLEWSTSNAHLGVEVENSVVSACSVNLRLECSQIENIDSFEQIFDLVRDWLKDR